MRHKLSNVVLHVAEHAAAYPEIYYRAEEPATYDPATDSLSFSGKVDFLTYFNACSVAKWRAYADVQKVFLHMEVLGAVCTLQFTGAGEDGVASALAPGRRLTSGEEDFVAFDLEVPANECVLVGFALQARGAAAVRNVYFYTEVEESAVNPVKLALATTTFKKEQYIVPNIELVRSEVLGCDEPVARNFHMFVVDNGRTLDAAALTGGGVTVLPNKNVGGAGGFARGMMEALASSEGFTHVLLMDDDVKVSTESFKRTYNLLALAQGKYRDAFINGAMLAMEEPNLLFEDVSFVRKSGVYRRLKEDTFIDRLSEAVGNECVNVEVPHAYGAWWFSCIPLSKVRENGLPLPLFVRCDDVEFGMRNDPVYMTMNGICVWHEAFAGRFRASVDCYQYVRNFLIMIAMDDCASEKAFIARVDRNVRLHLRTMEYSTVELYLDGFEDYLKGPQFLATVSGEDLMKENGAKNEKLFPVEEVPEAQGIHLTEYQLGKPIYDSGLRSLMRKSTKFLRTLPYDRHMLPDALLRDTPEGMFYSGPATLMPKSVATKTLVAFDLHGEHAAVRHMDRARYAQIKERWAALKKDYAKRGREVREAYKAAKPQLTAWEFWNDYLGTDLHPAE